MTIAGSQRRRDRHDGRVHPEMGFPLAWVLAYPVWLGPTGVFIAVSVGFSMLAVVSAWLFSKGTWKTQRV